LSPRRRPLDRHRSILLIGLGQAAVAAGRRVRYLTAIELVETLYRGLADNSVGRVIDGLLRAELVIVDELGCAPRGADLPGGQRGPPPAAATAGRSWGQPDS
jgi:hypothetical protein